MADQAADVLVQVDQLLSAQLDDATLLDRLTSLALAQEAAFSSCAGAWAPALYERNASFFGPFLVGYLDAKQATVIRDLLTRAEAARRDDLFADLYQKIADEKTWNSDVACLATSPASDAEVLQALQRRERTYSSRRLTEEAAVALYRRNPALFAEFVRTHVHRGWGKRPDSYEHLRQQALKGSDDDLYWALFREFATEDEWRARVRHLLASDTPASAIVGELVRRQPERGAPVDAKILAALVQQYGHAVLPYFEQYLASVPEELLSRVGKLSDETLYWRIFFVAGTQARWNAALRELLARPFSHDQLAAALRLRTPPDEHRHSWRLEKDVAQALYQRNADAFRPFLERFVTGGTAALQLPQLIQAAFAADLDRGALLHEMEALAQKPQFEEYADMWAPALYERDPLFFEPFLTGHLGGEQGDVVKGLLARAEAAGQDSFFTALYRKISQQDSWNVELAELATAPLPDEIVVQAVLRRKPDGWFTLTERTAAALYRRAPARLGTFVREHVQRGWSREKRTYKQLREEVRKRGDDDLYWALFRELADEHEWQAEMRRLLASHTPPDRVVAELTKRHPEQLWNVDTSIIADFVEQYGRAVLPYVQQRLDWVARRAAPKLLARIKKLGDDTLYWPIFFKAGNANEWNASLREQLARPLDVAAFSAALRMRTPPPPANRWSAWWLDPDVALALYRRNGQRFAPFLERFVAPTYADVLFEEAQSTHHEDFLDFLSLLLMRQIASWLYAAYPTSAAHRWQRPDLKAQDKIRRYGQMLTSRFDRLAAESPGTYVRHAAAMLSRIDAYDVWSFKRNLALNPAWAYLFGHHHQAWCAEADAMRELLESPNIYVQILGLVMLGQGSADAAQRVLDNLPILRALLLGRARLGTKKLALRAVELAARQGEACADRILPVLEEALHLTGKRALDERAMVAFVRLRRELPSVPVV
jgi:hypothetical protein